MWLRIHHRRNHRISHSWEHLRSHRSHGLLSARHHAIDITHYRLLLRRLLIRRGCCGWCICGVLLNSLLLRRILINNLRSSRRHILINILKTLEGLRYHHLRRTEHLLLLLNKGCHGVHHSLLLHHHHLLLLEEHLRSLYCLRDLPLGKLVNEIVNDIFGVLWISTNLLDQTLCNSRVLLVDLLD